MWPFSKKPDQQPAKMPGQAQPLVGSAPTPETAGAMPDVTQQSEAMPPVQQAEPNLGMPPATPSAEPVAAPEMISNEQVENNVFPAASESPNDVGDLGPLTPPPADTNPMSTLAPEPAAPSPLPSEPASMMPAEPAPVVPAETPLAPPALQSTMPTEPAPAAPIMPSPDATAMPAPAAPADQAPPATPTPPETPQVQQ